MRWVLAVLASTGVASAQSPPVDFARDVRPLLVERCVRCHGAERHEADLRLDRRAHVFRGDPDLWVVVPEAPDDSLLLELVTLPPDAPGHMPEEGEPLTEDEVDRLRRWIAEGASWPAAVDEAADASAARRTSDETVDVPELEGEALRAETHAIARAREIGVRVGPVAANTRALELDARGIGREFDDEHVARLHGLEPRTVWMSLATTAITDGAAEPLARFRSLHRLDLSRTAITDATLAAVAGLPELRSLNLHATAITDDGLVSLEALPRLQRVHLWRTAVTPTGVERLRAARPELVVDVGDAAERLDEPPPAR